MNAKNVRVSVYCSVEEAAGFRRRLGVFLPDGVEVGERLLPPEGSGGVFERPLVELSALASKHGDVEEILGKVFRGLRKRDVARLRDGLSLRVDDSCNFYMRFGKREFMEGGFYLREKDAIHFKIKVGVYPAKREDAVVVLQEYLDGLLRET